MKKTNNIKLLVLPELFPFHANDWKGVFVLIYIKSVLPFVKKCSVLFVKLTADKKGVFNTFILKTVSVKRVYISATPVKGIKKVMAYVLFFLKGLKYGKNYDCNVMHIHGSLFTGVLGRLLAKKMGVKYVVSEHTGPYSRIAEHPFFKRLAFFTYAKAEKVLTVSEYQKNQLIKAGVNPEKILVTYNPVDTDFFKPVSDKKKKQILFVSRLDKFKGGLRTLKAFHNISNKNTEWQLIICGEGEELNDIKNYIAINKLEKQVVLKPMQSHNELKKLYTESAFLVYLSLHETFGLVVAEALACGTPVLCSNRTSLPEIVTSENGILTDPENLTEISEKMQFMINHYPDFLPDKLHTDIEKRFGLTNFGAKLTTIYTSILN